MRLDNEMSTLLLCNLKKLHDIVKNGALFESAYDAEAAQHLADLTKTVIAKFYKGHVLPEEKP